MSNITARISCSGSGSAMTRTIKARALAAFGTRSGRGRQPGASVLPHSGERTAGIVDPERGNADQIRVNTWMAGRFGPEGAGTRVDEASDFRVMGRTGAALYGAGGVLALVWLALPHPNAANDLSLLATPVVAFIGAGVMGVPGARRTLSAY